MRAQRGHVDKRLRETWGALKRQAGGQIEVQGDVARVPQNAKILSQADYIRFAADSLQRTNARALHADFELEKAGARRAQQFELVRRQKVAAKLHLETGDAVVVFDEKAPDRFGARRVQIEGAVDKFDLHGARVKKTPQVVKNERQRARADPSVRG